MGDLTEEAENAPIATATRVPPEGFEADDGSDEDDEYPPILTATRVS